MSTSISKISIGIAFSALTLVPITYAIQNKQQSSQKTTANLSLKSNKQIYIESKVGSSKIPPKREFLLSLKNKPCDDFHAYVCENAESKMKLRQDRSSHFFSFDDSDERILNQKKKFFKNIKKEKKLSERSKQLRSYYLACMNEKVSIEAEQLLVRELNQEMQNIKSMDQFINLNLKNLTNHKWGFLGYGKAPNTSNPNLYDIYFDLDIMNLPEHSYYENQELIKEYKKLIVETFKILEPQSQIESLEIRAQNMIDFEIKFIKDYPYPAEFRQRWVQPRYVNRDEFFKKYSSLKLKTFFDENIPSSTLIRDFIPESLTFMNNELKEQNLNLLKDIYLYRNAKSFMDDAYPDLMKKRIAFGYKFLGGSPTRPERQERCTMSVMGSFAKELDQELIPRLFPNFPQSKMEEVVAKLRQSILEGIETNEWLTDVSKKGALEKIKTAQLQIIMPKNEREWDFKEIRTYSETNQYENEKILSEVAHKKSLQQFKEGVNKEAWLMGPLTVNAYYQPTANKFVMPMGILQYPFFDKDGDLIDNLGAVGTVVAHELGHAIDDQGAEFDAKGRLQKWMTDSDVKEFRKRGQKMIDQFNQIGHNGVLTLGENVADLVGVTFAYNAAFPRNTGKIEDKRRFFISYARLWCGVMREKTQESLLKTDSHSLGYARINEQVKHQAGFVEAFNCKEGDALYLKADERVKIW